MLYRVADMLLPFRNASFASMVRVLLCGLCAIGVVYYLFKPAVHPVAVEREGNIRHVDSWAETLLQKPHADQNVIVHIWSLLPVGKLQLYVDDCVQRVYVNGRGVNDKRFPYCSWYEHITVDISDFSHVGSNTVTVAMHNDRGTGKLRATSSYSSWFFIVALAACMSCITAFGAWWFMHARSAAARVTVVFVILGTLLRLYYAAYTEYDTRAYDWEGHMEYFKYVSENWVIPLGDRGWEFHQQPLYYIVGAAVLSVMRSLHMDDSFTDVMRLQSLLLSLGTLYAGAWIATLLFPEREKTAHWQRFAFIGLIATLPGIIMFSTRLNNDVPTLFFGAMTLGFLLSWWKHGTFERWAAAAAFATLAILTKSSSLPLLAPIGVAWLLRSQPLRARWKNAAFLGVLLCVAIGGTFVVRVIIQGQGELVPVWVSQGLRVKNFVEAYTTFDPWEVLMHPFNNNWIDTDRRQYMWEYFFRSAFFGEWSFRSYFNWGSIILLSSALLLLPAGVWGIFRGCWKPTGIFYIMASLLVLSLLALASFRFMHPNSSNQELRYIAFVVVPFGYFLAQGIAGMRYRWPFVIMACVMFAASSVFVVLMALHSY